MAFTPPVQTKIGNSPFNSNTFSLTFTSNVTKGNLLICVFSTGGPGNAPNNTITDNQGNVWTHQISRNDISGANVEIFWAVASAGGPLTVTLTSSPLGPTSWNAIIAEYPIQNAVLDTSVGSSNGSLSITTTSTPELLISGNADGLNGTVFGVDNSFTLDANSNQSNGTVTSVGLASRSVVGINTYNLNWTGTQFSTESGLLAFKAGSPPVTIGGTRYGVNTFLQVLPANQIPYRLCVNNNRLYCVLPDKNGIFSCFVYYLGRETDGGNV